MRKNCALVWAGAQNTIAKNATMIVTTARVFMLGSLLGFGLLVLVLGWWLDAGGVTPPLRCGICYDVLGTLLTIWLLTSFRIIQQQ